MDKFKTKLTEAQLALACMENGKEATRENMAVAAFLNDPEFREQVTRFMFNRALAQVRKAA